MDDIKKGAELNPTKAQQNIMDTPVPDGLAKPSKETFEISAKVNSREITDRIRSVLEKEQVKFTIKGSITPSPQINVSTSKGKNEERAQ